jgi:hypothetical protein
LAATGITNAGEIICGDLGEYPGSTVTGAFTFSPLCNGVSHIADAAASIAQEDLTTACNDVSSLTGGVTFTPIHDIGGQTLTPGLYTEPSSLAITGSVTLDGQNASNSCFIFRIGSTLITATDSQVVLINGATSANVFWQVGSSTILGPGSSLAGIIMAHVSITFNTGAVLEGRALAQTGAVVFDGTNVITNP